MKRGLWWLCLLLLALPCSAQTRASSSAFNGYVARIWTSRDGLADQTIQAIAQAPDGALWIGTRGGLLRFDGSSFANPEHSSVSSSLDRGVNCLLLDKDERLWIGTEGGGLAAYKDGAFETFAMMDQRPNEFIRALYQDSRGTIWVGSDQGLFRVEDRHLIRMDGTGGIPKIFVRAIIEDGHGNVWVGGSALLRFKDGSFEQLPVTDRAPAHSQQLILSMAIDHDGRLWVGTRSGLFRHDDSGEMKPVPGGTASVDALFSRRDGTIWAGTVSQGLYAYSELHAERASTPELAGRTIEAIFEDREKDIWLGTRSGIVRLSPTPVSIVPFPNHSDAEFESIYQDTDGAIFIPGTNALFRIQNERATRYISPKLLGLRTLTMLRDHNGDLWVGTEGSGLLHTGISPRHYYVPHHGIINNYVRAIIEGHDGTIWVGTDGGLTEITPAGSRNLDMQNGLAYFTVTCLLEDRQGDIWVGTRRGASHIHRDGLHIIYVQDAAVTALSSVKVWSIAQAPNGYLLFGTSAGLYGFDGKAVIHLTKREGLASDSVFQVLSAPDKQVWLGGPNSISRLPESELAKFANRLSSGVHLNLFLGSPELQSESFYSGMQPEGLVTAAGDVWFAGSSGAIHIVPSRVRPRTLFPVKIEHVDADGQDLAVDRRIELRAGNNRLHFGFRTISLGSSDGVRYRYLMGGLDSWSDPSSATDAFYNHIPPGTYTFRVQAFSLDGADAVSETSITVIQHQHFYTTWWFRSLVSVTVMILAWAIYRMRLQQMSIRFQAVTEERERLAREMHDTVIQGGIGVATLIEAALWVEPSDEPLRHQLMTFATEQMRSTIDQARDAVWALRNSGAPGRNVATLIEDLCQEFTSNFAIKVHYSISGTPFETDDAASYELLMATREALTNASKHAEATEVALSMCFSPQSLSISVRDNGKGFAVTQTSHPGHYGLRGMRERVEMIGGSLAIQSIPGQWTDVLLTVPRSFKGLKKMQKQRKQGRGL